MLPYLCSQSPTLSRFLTVMISVRVFAAVDSSKRKGVAFVQRTPVSKQGHRPLRGTGDVMFKAVMLGNGQQ